MAETQIAKPYDLEERTFKFAQVAKPYDLEERTFKFAQAVIAFIKKLPKSLANIETSRQLVRSTGSVGAN